MRHLPGALMPISGRVARALAIHCRTCASCRVPPPARQFSQLRDRDCPWLPRLAGWRQDGELVEQHADCGARGGEARTSKAGLHSRASEEAASASASTDEAGSNSGVGSGTDSRQGADVVRAFMNRVGTGLTGAKSSAAAAVRKVRETKLVNAAKDGYTFLQEELTSTGPRRKQSTDPPAPPVAPDTTATAVVAVKEKKSAWEERWDDWKGRAEAHPWYRKLRSVKEHPVYTKGEEIAEDLRDRWETSDSPVVHKIQDLNESVFGETATAMAIREIRKRDPAFSYPDFVAEVQQCVRPVLQAYVKGDTEALKTWCSEGVMIRCGAEMRALRSMGIYPDNKILHVSDVQVRETKLLGNQPVIIVSFQAQEINCARDREGNIVEGARDDIHTVYYLWAMQQVSPEEMVVDSTARWQLREMQKSGMRALV